MRPSYICFLYVYIYIYFPSSVLYIYIHISPCRANGFPTWFLCSLPPTYISSILVVVCYSYERRSLLMVALYLYACSGIYVLIHVDVFTFFVFCSSLVLRWKTSWQRGFTHTHYTHAHTRARACWTQFHVHTSSRKRLMCMRVCISDSRSNELLAFYHVFSFTPYTLSAVGWRIGDYSKFIIAISQKFITYNRRLFTYGHVS